MNDAVTLESILDRHAGLIRKFSHQYTTDYWSFDDLVQEARIALWREAEKRPGDNLDKIASYIIKRRVLNLAFGERPPFAHREAGGKTFSVKQTASLEGIASKSKEGLSGSVLDRLVGASAAAEDEYMRAENSRALHDAIDRLPERQRVVATGKLDEQSDAETAAVLGLSKARVGQLWRREVVPALMEALA